MGRWPEFLKSLKETGPLENCVFYFFVYSSLGSGGLLMNESSSDLHVRAKNVTCHSLVCSSSMYEDSVS